ncbi:MAG: hypothetical protein ABSC06_01535 [Rhodopila sp.]
MSEMQEMGENNRIEDFSLLGGPLHRLGIRVGLVRNGTNTVPLGLALGAFLWTVLLASAVIEGLTPRLFSVSVIAGHIRLLVVIPLFFMCEAWVDPMMTGFVSGLGRKEIVTKPALPALAAEIAHATRWKDSWFAEVLCLLAGILMSLAAPSLQLAGATAAHDPFRVGTDLTMAGLWYWIVCLTLFRFLLLRWLWRLCHWTYFLWRITKLELHLVPTHPDGAAGLGSLEHVHTCFIPLILAISALQSASFAEEISLGTMTFEAIYPSLVLTLSVDAVLFAGPLFLFSPRLWAAKIKGLGDYGTLASRYVDSFDIKWLRTADPGEPLLGTPDLQSLADLSNSVNVVRNMRLAPVSGKLWAQLLIAALLPMLPLLLIKYPLAALAEKFVTRLSGM